MHALHTKLVLGFAATAALGFGMLIACQYRSPAIMTTLLAAQLAVVAGMIFMVSRQVLRPLRELIHAAEQLRNDGNKNLPIAEGTPAAKLAQAFNDTCDAHRLARQTTLRQLIRTEVTVQGVINALPHAVILASAEGQIELLNARAGLLGLSRGKSVSDPENPWLKSLADAVTQSRQPAAMDSSDAHVTALDEGREILLLPQATPLFDADANLIGILFVLADVTASSPRDEAKSNLLSGFAHQLKTPMTSIQMSIHLLLEDAAARLTPRQQDLLATACEDSDRLNRVVEEILTSARKKL